MATRLEQAQEEREMKYWEHESYKGNYVPMTYRPNIINDTRKFKKTAEERALAFTMQEMWKASMKKKYGTDWKNHMKKEKLHN